MTSTALSEPIRAPASLVPDVKEAPSMSHIATVQSMYEAFGRGDVPAILEHLADDVEWDTGDPRGGHGVPWLAPRRGRQAVLGFFEALRPLEFLKFAPTRLLADGDTVVALIDLEVRARAGGAAVQEIDEVHIWRFDARGRVRSFRHRVDTALHLELASRV
jgi:ketosteroid isomerase-like protein